MPPISVLWLTKGLGPGGTERLLVAAADAHDRQVVAPSCAFVLPHKDHLVGELEARGVPCTCLAAGTFSIWPWRLRSLLRDGGFDIVHVHAPMPGSVARVVARTLPSSKRPAFVTTEHNAVSTYRLPVRWANSITSRWDAATITVSDEAMQSLRGRPRSRARSLQHGIDVESTSAQRVHRADIRRELGFDDTGTGPEDVIVIGTVANYREQKDYPNLLRAMAELRERGVACRLVAVGQGPLEQQVIAQVKELGLADIVTLTGFRPDATAVMSAFDVFVLASKWEGMPVALMEAFALGLPVVATAVGGVAEALTDGEDALLVPVSDTEALVGALRRVVCDAGERERLAAASRRRASDFDMSRAAPVIETIYRYVAGGKHRAVAHDDRTPETRVCTTTSGMTIRDAEPADRAAMIEMMRGPLQWGNDQRNEAFFAWKHDLNPFGPSPTWLALDGSRIVAVRTFMRWQFERDDETIHAVRAVDTVTDPSYEGRGLFRELTMTGLQTLSEEGVAFVFNTPNEQSRPGYLSMGWREVGHLPTVVLPQFRRATTTARSRVPADRWSLDLDVGVPVADWLALGGTHRYRHRHHQFERIDIDDDTPRLLSTPLDDTFLHWRYGSALIPYRVLDSGDGAAIVRARKRGSARELVVALTFGDPKAVDRLVRRSLVASRCDHALRLGHARLGQRALPMPGTGPMLTWRALDEPGMAPLDNWNLSLGDIELF